MDKQSTFGFILIGIVLVAWMWLQTPPAPPPQEMPRDTTHATAPGAPAQAPAPASRQPSAAKSDVPSTAGAETPATPEAVSRFFASSSSGTEKIVVITTDLYTAELTTKGRDQPDERIECFMADSRKTEPGTGRTTVKQSQRSRAGLVTSDRTG